MLKAWLKKRFDALPNRIRNKLYVALKRPAYLGQWLVPDTFFGARFHFETLRRIHWREVRGRREHIVPFEVGATFSVSAKQGFAVRDMSGEPLVAQALTYAREMLDKIDMEADEAVHKKSFLHTYRIAEDDPAAKPIFDLACDPILTDPVARYLGMVPVLQFAKVWFSPNTYLEQGRSQHYHMDGEDYRQVKVFIFVDDVDEQTGPLTVIPASESRKIYSRLRRRRVVKRRNTKLDDDVIRSAMDGAQGIPLIGPAGTVAFVDTCNCYHFGSRPGHKPRKILFLHYFSPFALEMPAWRRTPRTVPGADRQGLERPKLREQVLGLSHLSYNNITF